MKLIAVFFLIPILYFTFLTGAVLFYNCLELEKTVDVPTILMISLKTVILVIEVIICSELMRILLEKAR